MSDKPQSPWRKPRCTYEVEVEARCQSEAPTHAAMVSLPMVLPELYLELVCQAVPRAPTAMEASEAEHPVPPVPQRTWWDWDLVCFSATALPLLCGVRCQGHFHLRLGSRPQSGLSFREYMSEACEPLQRFLIWTLATVRSKAGFELYSGWWSVRSC